MARTCKEVELLGLSPESCDAAAGDAAGRASKALRGLSRFEVAGRRPETGYGGVARLQAVPKALFWLDGR
ncbi:MAG TPA: dodecin family protein [Deltaproteobacteria bacterium]|nr:dodecin family protein [Deltaproteobacteria bacterium]